MPWHWIQPSVKSWLSPPPNLFPQRLSAHLVTNHFSQKRVSSALDNGGHGIFRRQSCQRSHQESQRPSVTARILTRKLNLLSKVSSEGSLSYVHIPYNCWPSVSQTCAGMPITREQARLSQWNRSSLESWQQFSRSMLILKSDWKYCLSETSQHQSTSLTPGMKLWYTN